MGNIALDCNISLSKKLRSILGVSGKITLAATDLIDGKGLGKLILQSESIPEGIIREMPAELQGETSIQLTPFSITQAVAPTNASEEVGSIFSTFEDTNAPRTAVDRLAATSAPEKGKVQHAIVTRAEVKTPETFKELDDPACHTFVSSLTELMIEVEVAKDKVSDIDISKISDPRQRALAMEKIEMSEGIDKNAFIVNDQAGVLTINDLGITLALNAPYDLSQISAKRIAGSSELKGLIRSGIVKFISPDQITDYTSKAVFSAPTLEVFDKADQAEANMQGDGVGYGGGETKLHNPVMQDDIEVNADNFDEPTEEELMMQDLTASIGRTTSTAPAAPARPSGGSRGGVRRTTHGS
jgi:hypothetical protein